MKEEYRQLPNNRGYISNYGNYKNRHNVQLFGGTRHGYQFVYTGLKQERVHRLVAEAFLENSENKEEVNHIDGNKLNNHVSNLEWSTHLENMQHAVRTGLHKLPFGEKALKAKLTQAQVDYIKEKHIPRHPKYGQAALGRKFGVTNGCIWRIVRGYNWKEN